MGNQDVHQGVTLKNAGNQNIITHLEKNIEASMKVIRKCGRLNEISTQNNSGEYLD